MKTTNKNFRRVLLARFGSSVSILALTMMSVASAQEAGTSNSSSAPEAWRVAAMPKPEEPQPVTLDSAHTALLVLDMYSTFCSEAQRPRCLPTIPRIRRLLDEARARKMMVVYSGGPPDSTRFTMPPPALTPLPGEPMVRTSADKWLDTDLDKMLKARGIKSVIVTGTSAEGAVLYTASGAALRTLNVIVPLDAISSADPFGEVAAAWILKNTSGSVTTYVTLTRTDLITLK